ncbi:MAG: M20 family metallopeptidase, partial [Candidatus Woesearchaeota archaeon]
KDIYTKFLCDLIRTKTVNPPGDEYLAAKVLKKRLSKIGVKYKLYEKKKNRTNVVAKVGNEKGRQILIANHLDVVPAGEGWETDPFVPIIKEGVLYGRGSCDNKGPAVADILVLDYLKSVEKNLKNQFVFVFAADEEAGSTVGIKYLMSEGIISPDCAIIADIGGEMQKITVAEKGVLRVKVTAKGKQAHGSTPNKGISAIACLSKLITKLDYYILKHQLHKFLTRPTINFGTIKGGSAPNMVAGNCELVLDIRYLPSQTPEGIVDELKKLAERFGEFEFETLMILPPTEIDENNFLVETLKKAAAEHGITAKPKGLSGATDSKVFVLKDIPAVGFGFGDDDMAHQANENCRLDNLFKFSEVMIDACLDLDNRL